MQESYPICIHSQIAKEEIKAKAKQNNKITFYLLENCHLCLYIKCGVTFLAVLDRHQSLNKYLSVTTRSSTLEQTELLWFVTESSGQFINVGGDKALESCC